MIRVLLSFLVAAFVASTVVVVLTSRSSLDDIFAPIIAIGVVSFLFSLILGLPWLPVVRRLSLIKSWQVIGLAGFMAGFPFMLYDIFFVVGELSRGYTFRLLAQIYFDDLIRQLLFVLPMGLVSGAVIWVVGVWGNPYFSPTDS